MAPASVEVALSETEKRTAVVWVSAVLAVVLVVGLGGLIAIRSFSMQSVHSYGSPVPAPTLPVLGASSSGTLVITGRSPATLVSLIEESTGVAVLRAWKIPTWKVTRLPVPPGRYVLTVESTGPLLSGLVRRFDVHIQAGVETPIEVSFSDAVPETVRTPTATPKPVSRR